MDEAAARQKARDFAKAAYYAKVESLSRETQERIAEFSSEQAARGVARSGHTTAGIGRIRAEQVLASLDAKLDALMEGYELHGVTVDDKLAQEILDDLRQQHESQVRSLRQAVGHGMSDIGIGGPRVFMNAIEQHAPFSFNRYKAEIDRRRLMKRPEERPSITIYHLQGHNPRVNINSQDSSINHATVTTEQVFQQLRSAVMTLPESEERKEIAERLDALEQAKDTPSFGKRYTDFIAAAANHMTILLPFIPVLTEMLHKVI